MVQMPVREGIVMRSLTNADAPEVYKAIDANRAYLREWLTWVDGTDSPAAVESVIESWGKCFENKSDAVFGIFEKGAYIGNIGLHGLKSRNRSGMVGYWLAEGRQGRGIMSGCVRVLTDFGFCTLGLNRVYIHCAAGNKKSRAIPERLGFAHEGTFQDGECLYGVFHDLAVYGMVSRNWQKIGQGAVPAL